MIERAHSEFVVRLEDLVCSDPARSIDELRTALEADTQLAVRPPGPRRGQPQVHDAVARPDVRRAIAAAGRLGSPLARHAR